MRIPHAYKKIMERLENQYGNWNKEWTTYRNNVRTFITGIRLTKQDAEMIIKELESMQKMKRINRRKIKLLI